MSFEVNVDRLSSPLDQFTGPLDLMLHTIKTEGLDLFDLDVSVLTSQYLSYLNKVTEMKLDIESDYLVELAALIEYKSKKLLPIDDVEFDVEYEEDFKNNLVNRLIEYQRFKEVAGELENLYTERNLLINKPMENIIESFSDDTELEIDNEINDLVKAMQRCIKRSILINPLKTKITTKEISVDEMIVRIKNRYGSLKSKFSFTSIVNDCENLTEAIVSFLSILDLIRLGLVVYTVSQDEEIWLMWG